MTIKIFCLVAIGAIAIGICNGAPLNSDEEEARKFLQAFSVKMYNYYDAIANISFSMNIKLNQSTAMEKVDEMLTISEKIIQLVNEAKNYDYQSFKDEELKYIFEIIRQMERMSVVGADQIMEVISSMLVLDRMATDEDIVSYKDKNIRMAYLPDIQNIFESSIDPNELLHYWNTFRSKNAELVKSNFPILIKTIQNAANITEITPYEFWRKHRDFKQMENVMNQLQPFHQQMHGFIRNKLNKKYGDSVVKPYGLIPAHLFEQVLAQAWTNGSIIDDMYPHESLPQYDSILKQKHFDTLRMFKMADQFYQSLGFQPIPDDYWGSRLCMKASEDKGDCKAHVYHSRNLTFLYCQKMDFKKLLQAHGYMGEIYYVQEKSDLPVYYFDSYDLENSVGEAVILSASTPKHLTTMGIVDDFKFTDDVMMNRLIRKSIHTMLNIPVYYVHNRIIADLFSGVVELADLNKHYWKLMDQYVGVGPPGDRDGDGFDFSYTLFNELKEKSQGSKFYSEVLAYQFYKKMCDISGQYPKEPLHNCDFYGSKEVGDALKKMMKLGSSKPFHKVLETFLPEDAKVNGESLLEYYHPVQIWLTENNHESGVKLGWTHLDRKIESVNLPSIWDKQD